MINLLSEMSIFLEFLHVSIYITRFLLVIVQILFQNVGYRGELFYINQPYIE